MKQDFDANFDVFTSSFALVCSLASQHFPLRQQMLVKNGWSPQRCDEERTKVVGDNERTDGCLMKTHLG
jgi:hypothetical protein